MVNIHELLKKLVELEGSDLHLIPGISPIFRVNGKTRTVFDQTLNAEDCSRLCYSVMSELQQKQFEKKKELDFSFGIASLGRFRANIYFQRGSVSMAIRYIPYEIKNVSELGLPKTVLDFVDKPSGLVLVTGSTGSGKSTTLAALIDRINSSHQGHILTIEDPIEFVHKHKKCIVSQREVNADTVSFASALRVALRQDPDFVLIGEMRDVETIEAALTIAETGHLTLATLHTNSAVQTINRIIDAFPESHQAQIRTQLSFVLQGVISQVLLPCLTGGRILATEILVSTPAVSAMIRDEKNHQIQGMIETGQKYGMHTMDACLVDLVAARKIEKAEALRRCSSIDSFNRLLSGKVR
ncbi:type IV pilus twitching motility protein PilT [Fibrobacterota bacterium]